MSRLAGDAKFLFYPTHLQEVYRIIACLCTVSRKTYEDFDEVTMLEAEDFAESISDYSFSPNTRLVHYLIEKQEYALIHKYFDFSLGYAYNKGVFPILDPFAGQGEWLGIARSLIEDTLSIAVEIEKERFDVIEADYKQHGSFEDCDIPRNSVKLLLYNPPYGATNGVRNVRHYLQLILDRKILAPDAAMVAVIRGDDLLDCADILFDNFDLRTSYRVNDAEFSKFKQYVLYFNTFESRLTGINKATKFSVFKQHLERIVAEETPFHTKQYRNTMHFGKSLDWNDTFKLHKRAKSYQVAKPDKIWDWATKSKEAKLGDTFELLMPRAPKISEIANILASGIINGYIHDENGGSHVASGGVKLISRKEKFIEETDHGPVEKERETRFSKPFLNILVKQKGKLVVKEIQGNDT